MDWRKEASQYFSSSLLVSVNCHLSEVSESDIQSRILRQKNSWSLFSLAPDECDNLGGLEVSAISVETDDTPDSDNCDCNGLIDLSGGGECRLLSESGSWWCYVNGDSNCPDSTPDPAITQLSRSSIACSKGLQKNC